MAGCLGHTSNRPTCGAVIARRGEGMAFLGALVTVIISVVTCHCLRRPEDCREFILNNLRHHHAEHLCPKRHTRGIERRHLVHRTGRIQQQLGARRHLGSPRHGVVCVPILRGSHGPWTCKSVLGGCLPGGCRHDRRSLRGRYGQCPGRNCVRPWRFGWRLFRDGEPRGCGWVCSSWFVDEYGTCWYVFIHPQLKPTRARFISV